MISRTQLHALRACLQHLAPTTQGHTPEDVYGILKTLEPVAPASGGMPGTAPHPRSRMADYEDDWTERWHANGSLVKGRFLNGNVAYVAREDLALYAAAFRRSMRDPMPLPARRVLDLLRRHGPMLMSTLRDQTGLERGRFNRALMALNQAFEVMEIQHTLDWNSPWDLFRRAYPEADLEKWEQVQAQESVLPPNDPLALPQWSLILQRFRNERLPYCLGVIVEDGEIVGAAWGHYKRRYAHIEELNVVSEIVHVSPYIDSVLTAVESHVSAGNAPVCI